MWDSSTTFSFKGGFCVGVPLDSFVGAGDAGPIAGFMFVLGPMKFGHNGGQLHVKHTTAVGGTTNSIDATVTAKIESKSGH